MKPIRILIVEDEMIIAAKISLHLEQLNYDVMGIIPRGERVLEFCRNTPPDILLLDINLKGDMDGVETAAALQQEMDIPIIYLTANSEEATFERAKATRPYAFVTKPYKKTELRRTIELVVNRIMEEATPTVATDIPYDLQDRIFVKYKNKMIKICLEDILYVEAERSYCRIFTKEKEYLLSMPLSRIEQKLPSRYFLRTHRSYMINLKHVNEVGDIYVQVGEQNIPIARAKREELLGNIRLL